MSNKHSKKRTPPQSIDGMSYSRRPSVLDSGSGFKQSAPYRRGSTIGNFKAREGFNPADSRLISASPNSNFNRHKNTSLYNKKPSDVQLDGAGRAKKGSKKSKFIKAFAVFAAIMVISGGFLSAKGYLNLRKILDGSGGAAALQQDVDPQLLSGEGDGRINVLISGRGGPAHEAPDLTDTVILASIDPLAKEAGLISIPRDFYVDVPDFGGMKINQVFYTGKTAYLSSNTGNGKERMRQAEEAGMKLLDDVVSDVLGLPVHYHGIVDFTGFKKAVDTVGGVDLDVPSTVIEQMLIEGQPYKLDVKPGQQHFGGFEALAYSRSRYTSPRGDFDRSERQRLIILALKQKIFSADTYSNPVKVGGLLDDLGNHIKTNFSLDDVNRMYQISSAINSGRVISVGLVDPPNNYVTTGDIGGLSVVLPSAGAGNYEEIHNYIRNAIRDSFIRQENPNVLVLNGTRVAGAAKQKAGELKSYGYNVVKIDDAPAQNYSRNVLVDRRNGEDKYTKRYLELRLGTAAVNSLPDSSINPGNADFVIIVGE
jgi:LCP family protein required for cell wall assembly